ncbi:MAG TPA: peptide chain release factor N(5)-glutamine methyltransferase [Frankiaceae bacterium]|nr:peptide chain release factor N(5)-glutamine methyltransferase [Frankiaceae bacterium]
MSRTLIAEAADQLAAAGVASPRHDAEALAAHVLRVARGRLALVEPAAFEAARPVYAAAVARRASREPLQHVVGSAPFRRLELAVGPGVLIPRPETELLVDSVLGWLRKTGLIAPRIVDLGTGSGAIALALADETPAGEGTGVWAVERDPAALVWAARNIKESGLAVELVDGDMVDALHELDGTIDVVVSNPPYLSLDLLPDLEPEVRDHDPAAALFAGADPLAAIRTVEASARRLLRPGGFVVVEHGDDQAESAPACFAGWNDVSDHLDLARRPRYLTAVHP